MRPDPVELTWAVQYFVLALLVHQMREAVKRWFRSAGVLMASALRFQSIASSCDRALAEAMSPRELSTPYIGSPG